MRASAKQLAGQACRASHHGEKAAKGNDLKSVQLLASRAKLRRISMA